MRVPEFRLQDSVGPSKASEELFSSAAKSSARLGLGFPGLKSKQASAFLCVLFFTVLESAAQVSEFAGLLG